MYLCCMQIRDTSSENYSVIELFSGAGGMALGLHKAGFTPIALIDFFEDANQTIRLNNPTWNVITEDVNDVAENGIYKYIGFQKADLLAGGFPCQPFSYAGKRKGLSDTRGTVFFSLCKIASEVKPKVILLENVKGLLTHDNKRTFETILQSIDELGYNSSYRILNAWDYGVAQKRERLIIVAIRKDISAVFHWPKPYNYRPTLRDVLKDVPLSDGQQYPEKKRLIMELVPQGGCWVDLPTSIAKEYMGKSYYSGGGKRGMARRLAWDEPSLTLTCSPAQKQTERCHPEETRPFTVREYARIQSFPDDYIFYGSTGSKYKQIGNAVPVNLAYAIGRALHNLFNQIENTTKE